MKMTLDILKNAISVVCFLILFSSCGNIIEKNAVNNNALAKKVCQDSTYRKIYNSINDSVKMWALNGLQSYRAFGQTKEFIIDSNICLDIQNQRFVTCILHQDKMKIANSDGITILCGEIINNMWYFFSSGMYFIIPRNIYKNQDIRTPLNYSQLHEQAYKNVLSGYLNTNGEPNELWFTEHFEDIGWGDFKNQESSLEFLGVKEKFTDKRKFFEAIHLQSVKNNWYGVKKDSIKDLP